MNIRLLRVDYVFLHKQLRTILFIFSFVIFVKVGKR